MPSPVTGVFFSPYWLFSITATSQISGKSNEGERMVAGYSGYVMPEQTVK